MGPITLLKNPTDIDRTVLHTQATNPSLLNHWDGVFVICVLTFSNSKIHKMQAADMMVPGQEGDLSSPANAYAVETWSPERTTPVTSRLQQPDRQSSHQ